MKDLQLGYNIRECSTCSKDNIGAQLYELFEWRGTMFGGLGFDKGTQELLVSEQMLMRIIMMVNPAQMPHKIRLVATDKEVR